MATAQLPSQKKDAEPLSAKAPRASLPRIHFFRPGRHTAMSGQEIEFTADDLSAAAAAYDPAKWQAPIVVGHPQIDAPAYGWVKRVADQAGELYAEPDQVEAQFAELVREGRFKKVSAAWFTPEHPRNPAPGVYYLKHIGFLGAAAPAVSGLKPVEFAAEADDLVLEFAWEDKVNAGLWRRMREWLIAKFGLDEADKVIPDYSVGTLEEEARREAAADAAAPMPLYAAPPTEGDSMSDADKARLAELEAQAATLSAQNATLVAQMAEADRLKRHAEHAAFAEAQVKAGRLTPAMSPVIVQALDVLGGLGEAPQFGEGDAAQPLTEALKAAIAAAPVVVDFAERSAPGDESAAVAAFAVPQGYAVDAAGADTHARAIAWQKAHPDTDYLAAVKAVSIPA